MIRSWLKYNSFSGLFPKILLKENNGNKYHVLDENDYNLTIKDQGTTLFGGIHKKDMLEDFEIKNPKAVLTNEKLTLYADDQRHLFYTNRDAGNDTRLLVIGDSYFGSFLMDDIAESFYETVLIWGDYNEDIGNIIEEYNADIVIIENAERVDRTGAIINGVNAMKSVPVRELPKTKASGKDVFQKSY